MVPFTKQEALLVASAITLDNSTSQALEGATGAVSLEANSYESFRAEVAFNNQVAAAVSVSFQFYGSDAASGDVSATWTKIGVGGSDDAIVDASAATSGLKLLKAELHSREIPYKYVSVIATATYSDQGASAETSLTLRGVVARRDE